MIAELCKMWADAEARISRVDRRCTALGVAVILLAALAEIDRRKQRDKVNALEKEIETLKGLEGE